MSKLFRPLCLLLTLTATFPVTNSLARATDSGPSISSTILDSMKQAVPDRIDRRLARREYVQDDAALFQTADRRALRRKCAAFLRRTGTPVIVITASSPPDFPTLAFASRGKAHVICLAPETVGENGWNIRLATIRSRSDDRSRTTVDYTVFTIPKSMRPVTIAGDMVDILTKAWQETQERDVR